MKFDWKLLLNNLEIFYQKTKFLIHVFIISLENISIKNFRLIHKTWLKKALNIKMILINKSQNLYFIFL